MTGPQAAFPNHELVVDRVATIRRASLFSAAAGRDLAGLATRLETVEFRSGDVLMRTGAVEEWMLVLVEGQVEVIRQDGRMLIHPVDTVGELAVLDPGPRTATVVAGTDGIAFRLAKEDFDEALRLRPEMAGSIITALARRFRETRGGGGVSR